MVYLDKFTIIIYPLHIFSDIQMPVHLVHLSPMFSLASPLPSRNLAPISLYLVNTNSSLAISLLQLWAGLLLNPHLGEISARQAGAAVDKFLTPSQNASVSSVD